MAMRNSSNNKGRSRKTTSGNKKQNSFHPAFKDSKGKKSKEGKEGKSGSHSKSNEGEGQNRGFKKAKKEHFKPSFERKSKLAKPNNNPNEGIRLNKYIANAGICARREADILIEAGAVTVNNKVVQQMGYKVMPGDVVKCDGQTLRHEALRYVLLNKPKDFVTSMKDPFHKRTVMWLVKNACKERIFPVGRLDKDTTGLLLFTNDGDLAMKLTHPGMKHKKIYHVELDKKVKLEHVNALKEGIELEDGFVKADEASFVGESPYQVGVEIHVGRNRIVRRMFAHFGYNVKKLDRVYFAGLTKKDLPRGKFRFLNEEEIVQLKHF